ncbi:kanadaptin [Clonorchis sinensis]|uniref:Kanadaptin n=1 Tax=Clonorchis sinensis TaxID=79923 RepID=G7YTU1_CLOSI|nr:kanadaptin [Clonorchis sinensis]
MSSSPTPIESNPCTEATPNEESETPNTQNQLSSPISECTGKDEVSDYLCEDKTQVFVQPKLQPAGNTYKPPVWAMPCPADLGYRFEVIKNGTPLSECTVTLSEAGDSGDATELSFCLFGRQPQPFYAPYNRLHGQCVALAHPSISRLHAVLQYGRPPPSIAKTSLAQPEAAGWYIQDLESTHGTFVNKRRLPSGRFVRIHVGHVVRFGGSTRLNVLQGPEDDTERESTLSWTELKQVHFAKKAVAKERTVDKTPETTVDFGCDWGLAAEDAAADVPSFLRDINGAACLSHENLYQDDPKRALRTYFEREGIDPAPEFEFVEASFGKQHCKIDLPLSSGTITAEAIVAGKRKEAIAQCALEACRLLDRLGEFDPNKDQSTAAKRIRTKAYWEEHDYYSSDEDTFTDRTGHVERKRLSRIRQLGVEGREAEEAERRAAEHATATCPYSAQRLDNATLLTVLAELEKVGEEIVSLEEKLEKINKEFTPQGQNPSELDELEAYMKALKSGQARVILVMLIKPTVTSKIAAESFPGSLEHRIPGRTVAVLKCRRNVPAGPEHHLTRRVVRYQMKVSVRADREVWWTRKVKEMEEAQRASNARRLFQLIRVTGHRKPHRSIVPKSIFKPRRPVCLAAFNIGTLKPTGSLEHRIPGRTVAVLKCRRNVPAGPEHHLTRRVVRYQMKVSVRADREVWWTRKVKEMEEAQRASNARRLFQLIRVTGHRKPHTSARVRHLWRQSGISLDLKGGAPSRKERLKLRSQLFTLRQREMRLFQQAGLPQPRQRVKLITTGGEEGEERVPVVEKTVRADAAAAVRAAKRKLQEDTGAADSHEVAPEQGPKNARLLRNEIKRSLAGHRTVQQSDRTRHVSEDQPFEVEEDDDEEVAAPTEQSTLRDRPDPNSPAVPSETDLTTSNKDELESITGPKMPTEHRIDGVVVIEHKPAVETASKPMGDNKGDLKSGHDSPDEHITASSPTQLSYSFCTNGRSNIRTSSIISL